MGLGIVAVSIAWIALISATGVVIQWVTLILRKVRLSYYHSVIIAGSIYLMLSLLINGGLIKLWI